MSNYIEELNLDINIDEFEFPELRDDYIDDEGVHTPAEQHPNQAHRYAWRILTGDIPACIQVKRACLRHVQDIIASRETEYPFKYNLNRATHILNFYKICKHVKGSLEGKPMLLMQWQQFIVCSLFGWVTKEVNKTSGKRLRRFRIAEIFVARKNGKSAFSSPMALYLQVMDGEAGAEVYSAATSREQASIVWKDAAVMVSKCDLKEIIKERNNLLSCKANNSVYKPLSSDASTGDGLNVHGAIIDEIHAHAKRDLYDVVETATAARSQPLIVIISTAGIILDGIAIELWDYGEAVLDPDSEVSDDSFFAILYTVDKGDKFNDEDAWIKANPCLRVSKDIGNMRSLATKASTQVSAQGTFLTKHLNVFTNVGSAWLDNRDIEECSDTSLDLDNFKNAEITLGMDLAEMNDMASVQSLVEVKDGKFLVFTKAFLPRSAIDKAPKAQQQLYAKWESEGWLTVSEESTLDFDIIFNYIMDLHKTHKIKGVGYDPYKASQLVIKLQSKGIPCFSIGQNVKMLSEVSKTFETQILQKKINYDGNPVFRWCCNNAKLINKVNGTVGVEKERPSSPNKIDTLVATLIGLRCHQEIRTKSSIYNEGGTRSGGILML